MAEAAENKAEAEGAVPSMSSGLVDKKKFAAVDAFLSSFVKSAKTIALYEEGHDMIGQIVERVINLLNRTLGRESSLMVRVKSKNIFYEDAVIEETEEMLGFASALHVLGIGQIAFSNKIQVDGMLKFMRMITERPDLKRTLVDMQRDVHTSRIDGLQLISIMSFVETVDDVEEMTPGELSEEQVAAFCAAATLPDFLFLLFHQNEPLTGKAADKLTILFDSVMDRDMSLAEFEKEMPWKLYDKRIRVAWKRLLADISGRKKWTRDALYSDLSVLTAEDAAFKAAAKPHDAEKAFDYALADVHSILSNPAGDKQPKYALFAYTRLLGSMAWQGDLEGLLKEVDIWRSMAGDAKWAAYLAALRKEVQERIPQPNLSNSIAQAANRLAPDTPAFAELKDFILTVGHRIVPMLIADLKALQEREHRQKLCALLAAACRQLGPDDLFDALGDEDYLQVAQIVGILTDIGMPGSAEKVAPLLKHAHTKVRRAVFQALRRFGGAVSVDAMAEYIIRHKDAEEVKLGVTSLSLINHPNVGEKLVQAYLAKEDYDVKVAIVTALGRFGSRDTLNFLNSIDHWGWFDWATGKNKALREAVKASISQVKKELQDG